MPELELTTFAGACKKFFGLKQGETLQEFVAELKALTAEDKEEMKVLFLTVGYDCSKN